MTVSVTSSGFNAPSSVAPELATPQVSVIASDGTELAKRGLYLDLPGWRPTVLALSPAER